MQATAPGDRAEKVVLSMRPSVREMLDAYAAEEALSRSAAVAELLEAGLAAKQAESAA